MELAKTVRTDVHQFDTEVQIQLEQDTQRVTALEAVVAMNRGSLLTGFILSDAPEFETWLIAEQTRFRELYFRVLEMMVAAYRPHDAGERLEQQIANWQCEGIVHELPLPPLDAG